MTQIIRMKSGTQFRPPLVRKDDVRLEGAFTEGELFELYDGKHWLGRGYLGRQNRGIGWVLSDDPDENIDASLFSARIEAALSRRGALFSDPSTDCFRVFHAEGDGIGGLTVDAYGSFGLISWYSRGVMHFRAPVIDALARTGRFAGLYEKMRFTGGEDPSGPVWGQAHPDTFTVREHGIRYRAWLDDGPMTGVFPDQRDVRLALIERYAAGRSVLNTFSYSGVFSVACRMAGALRTVSVDLARRSLRLTRDNFSLNGIDPDGEQIVVQDVFDHARYARRKGLSYDLLIVDPPSFSRSKTGTFKAEKDYGRLVSALLPLAAPGAVLVLSTNCARMTKEAFQAQLVRAFKRSGRKARLLETFRNPVDFPAHPLLEESNYLKVLMYEVN